MFQVFLYKTNNLHTVICFKYFYPTQIICTKLYVSSIPIQDKWFAHGYIFQVFLSKTNNLHTVICFKYFYPRQMICTQLYISSNPIQHK